MATLRKELTVFILLFSAVTLSHAIETTETPAGQPSGISAQQRDNILGALIGAQDFFAWADVLRGTDLSDIPLTSTLFVPTDDGVSFPSTDKFISQKSLRYHIVPHQFSFQDLLRLDVGTRLPTLLPNHTIVVTNNTRTNFTIDDSRILNPDLYYNGAISVHGVSRLLNYTKFGIEIESQPETKRPWTFLVSDRDPQQNSLPSARRDLPFSVIYGLLAGWFL